MNGQGLFGKLFRAFGEWRMEHGRRGDEKSGRGLRLLVDTAGLACLAVSAGMVAVPLGVAVAGVCCFIFSWRIGR